MILLRDIRPRRLEGVVRELMVDEPVVALVGPRTVGKRTLLRRLAADHGADVIDLDDVTTRLLVENDLALYASGPRPVLIDEFQHVPRLLDAIKSELNRDPSPGRFVLTGSTRYSTLPRAAQSLTGRVHVEAVWPLSQGEIHGTTEKFLTSSAGRCSTSASATPASATASTPCPSTASGPDHRHAPTQGRAAVNEQASLRGSPAKTARMT